jgi:hypothetical protein
MKFKKYLIAISIFLSMYFNYLIYVSKFSINSEIKINFIQFFLELLTIPFLLMLFFLFFYSIFNIFKNIEQRKSMLLFSINCITVVVLIVATIFE